MRTITTPLFAVLALAGSAAGADEPAPPPRPAPTRAAQRPDPEPPPGGETPEWRWNRAKLRHGQRRYAEALEDYLWAFDHGPEYGWNVGVRTSYLLYDLEMLGAKYAPAVEAMAERLELTVCRVVGNPPTTPTDAWTRYCEARGLSDHLNVLRGPLFDIAHKGIGEIVEREAVKPGPDQLRWAGMVKEFLGPDRLLAVYDRLRANRADAKVTEAVLDEQTIERLLGEGKDREVVARVDLGARFRGEAKKWPEEQKRFLAEMAARKDLSEEQVRWAMAYRAIALADAPKRLGVYYRALAGSGRDADAREVADLMIAIAGDKAYPVLVGAALAARRYDLAARSAGEAGRRPAPPGTPRASGPPKTG